MINYFYENISIPIKLKKKAFYNYIKNYSSSLGYKSLDINYIFCNDDYLLEINREYLKHDYYTDTITFSSSTSSKIAGDIFISIDRILENYKLYGSSFEEELYRVMIHGFLHLLGYVDKASANSKNEMVELQERLLKDFLITLVSRGTSEP